VYKITTRKKHTRLTVRLTIQMCQTWDNERTHEFQLPPQYHLQSILSSICVPMYSSPKVHLEYIRS